MSTDTRRSQRHPDTGVNTLTGEGLAEVLDGRRGRRRRLQLARLGRRRGDAVLPDVDPQPARRGGGRGRADITSRCRSSGTDRLTESGYFRAKLAQEELIEGSSIPYSIVHATQFFEFMNGIADAATDGNTVRLPPALIQPMAADDVASAVARVAVGPPLNGIVEVAGPEQFRLDELIRGVLKARNDPREVITDPQARYFGITPGERTLLPAMTRASADPLRRLARDASQTRHHSPRSRRPAMHEIRVSVVSPEAADHGVAELWAAEELIGYTILEDSDLMLHIEPRRDHTAVVVGAHSLAQALSRAKHLLEQY